MYDTTSYKMRKLYLILFLYLYKYVYFNVSYCNPNTNNTFIIPHYIQIDTSNNLIICNLNCVQRKLESKLVSISKLWDIKSMFALIDEYNCI